MKATGIVRRIDDLGRVVIPKEIRRSMGLREGDALEIFTDRGSNGSPLVMFQKYRTEGLVSRDIDEIIELTADCNSDNQEVFYAVRQKMYEAQEMLKAYERAERDKREMGVY